MRKLRHSFRRGFSRSGVRRTTINLLSWTCAYIAITPIFAWKVYVATGQALPRSLRCRQLLFRLAFERPEINRLVTYYWPLRHTHHTHHALHLKHLLRLHWCVPFPHSSSHTNTTTLASFPWQTADSPVAMCSSREIQVSASADPRPLWSIVTRLSDHGLMQNDWLWLRLILEL